MPAVKVGTCNYCGTRAALVLRGDKRHELACSSCGAPLHDLKIMPKPQPEPKRPARNQHHPARPAPSHTRAMSKPKKKYKKRKSFKRRFFEEVFDLVEDIFD